MNTIDLIELRSQIVGSLLTDTIGFVINVQMARFLEEGFANVDDVPGSMFHGDSSFFLSFKKLCVESSILLFLPVLQFFVPLPFDRFLSSFLECGVIQNIFAQLYVPLVCWLKIQPKTSFLMGRFNQIG